MVEGVQGYTDPPPGNHIPGGFPIPIELWRMYVISEENEQTKAERKRGRRKASE